MEKRIYINGKPIKELPEEMRKKFADDAADRLAKVLADWFGR